MNLYLVDGDKQGKITQEDFKRVFVNFKEYNFEHQNADYYCVISEKKIYCQLRFNFSNQRR